MPLFDALHIAILVVVFLCGPALAWSTQQNARAPAIIRGLLASILFAIGLSWYIYRFGVQHVRWLDGLPFELSDVSLWLTVIALLALEQVCFELAYYWGLSGASMAMLTPNLTKPIASFPSVVFLAGHGLLVVSILYLLSSHQARPRRNAWLTAFYLLNAYAVFVGIFDYLAGTNYMYLRHKPANVSMLDFFGSWPWYVIGGDVAALCIIFVMGLPFRKGEEES